MIKVALEVLIANQILIFGSDIKELSIFVLLYIAD